ncbi:MFS transporter [Prauserella aidingensis]|uniref:MFS transporter n=1 Tax=Prauserella aidingensis TaxID=387890 RepID=UPI0020A23450|nr:MFS transporter [Prauserella aidingensis]
MPLRRNTGLAFGIVALEFGAAVTGFVASTLLPVVATDLVARDRLGLLIAGSTLGLFVALPLATRVIRRIGAAAGLTAGVVGYVGGLAVAASSGTAWVFAAGQFSAGLSSGLLGVFGIGAAIEHLDDRIRERVVAASAAMWILPALVGPAATLGLEHLVGWRWTLLVPVPIVLFGRVLVARVVRRSAAASAEPARPLGRTLLVPLGACVLVLDVGGGPLAVLGCLVAIAGTVAIMPRGTATLRRGTPRRWRRWCCSRSDTSGRTASSRCYSPTVTTPGSARPRSSSEQPLSRGARRVSPRPCCEDTGAGTASPS